jgi:hypothetical protein
MASKVAQKRVCLTPSPRPFAEAHLLSLLGKMLTLIAPKGQLTKTWYEIEQS